MKKSFVLLLTVFMLLSFTACGKATTQTGKANVGKETQNGLVISFKKLSLS